MPNGRRGCDCSGNGAQFSLASDLDTLENECDWDLLDRLYDALDALPYRLRRTVELRFGLGNAEQMSLGQVAQAFQVTDQTILNWETEALAILRELPQLEVPGE